MKWRNSTNDIDVLLRDKLCKTADDEQLSSCVSFLKMPQVWERLWRDKLHRKWAQQALWLSGGKKRVVDKVVMSFRSKTVHNRTSHVETPNSVLVALGIDLFQLKKNKESFKKAHDARMIEEFKTSKTCPRYDYVLQEVRGKV